MTIEVEITLRETVRPSSPTPPHLKKFNMSPLDQLARKRYTPIIFYYPNMAIHNTSLPSWQQDSSSKLKDSLSKTLTEFYPLAGRVRDNLWIDCKDQGALYSEAVVNCRLAEFLDPPDIEALYKLVPFCYACSVPEEEAFQVAVQINVFACRGIAIGVSFLHRLIDGTLMGACMKRWASIARGSDTNPFEKDGVTFDFRKISSLFPPKFVLPSQASNWCRDISCSTSRVARLVFSPESISKIVAKFSSNTIPRPSRIEALSTFLWKRAMHANSGTGQKPSMWTCVVNMRRRMDPTLPENSIGNIIWTAFSFVERFESNSETELVKVIRKSLSDINDEFIEKLLGDKGCGAILNKLEDFGELYEKCESNDLYKSTSWTNNGFNELDFGWGRPIWVSVACMPNLLIPFKNVVVFLESTYGKGIEAWLLLDDEEMRTLEHDQEVLAFASINPSIPC